MTVSQSDKTQFILYACPTGELGQQLDIYFEKSLVRCGPNTAHQYMPHCTLTGFFEDFTSQADNHTEALKQALAQQRSTCPITVAEITRMSFQDDWYGLELNAPWFQQLAKAFANLTPAPSSLRLKSWLHISLAYGFESAQADTLQHLALQIVNPQAPVTWEIRLYQRQAAWVCHYAHVLPS